MAHLISFSTRKFEPAKEKQNPSHPIAGQSVLQWLIPLLKENQYQASEPDAEDWGWFTDVKNDGTSYRVGASGKPEKLKAEVDWVVKIEKNRNIFDKLFGRNQFTLDDPLAALIEKLIRKDAGAKNIFVDKNT